MIVDEVPAWSEAQTIEFLELPNHDTVVMRGRLLMESGNQSWPYVLELREEEGRRLGFKVQVSSDEGGASVTHVRLEAQEDAEGVYGFGAQFSYLNLRGQRVPVWVSEQGVSAIPTVRGLVLSLPHTRPHGGSSVVCRAGGSRLGAAHHLHERPRPPSVRGWPIHHLCAAAVLRHAVRPLSLPAQHRGGPMSPSISAS